MTAFSTLLSIVVTPFLLELYMGSSVDIPAKNMFVGLLKIVLVPVFIGTLVRTALRNNKSFVAIIHRYSHHISQVSIIAIITIVVALNAEKFSTVPVLLYISVILHNVIGMIVGYYVSIAFIKDRFIARTVAIEVGMQNSGLAVGLAIKYFNALVAIPAAVFSVIHNISGSLYAGFIKAKDK